VIENPQSRMSFRSLASNGDEETAAGSTGNVVVAEFANPPSIIKTSRSDGGVNARWFLIEINSL
jgi:hypothetical protein